MVENADYLAEQEGKEMNWGVWNWESRRSILNRKTKARGTGKRKKQRQTAKEGNLFSIRSPSFLQYALLYTLASEEEETESADETLQNGWRGDRAHAPSEANFQQDQLRGFERFDVDEIFCCSTTRKYGADVVGV